MSEVHLPFHIGQTVEARSFEEGFRGAWFRCKIRDISRRKNGFYHKLEYLDFPDEKTNFCAPEIHQTKLYQKLKLGSKDLREKEHLMVRPEFPPVYRESEVADVNGSLATVVVVNDVWEVGDLADWFFDDCYWSGRIIEVLENDKVRIELFPEPIGEGCSYEASFNDLRPSLDFSPDNGWTVPLSKDGGKERRCARLIKPVNRETVDSLTTETLQEGELKNQPNDLASVSHKDSPSPQNSPLRTATRSEKGSDVSDRGSEEEDTGWASKKLKTDGNVLLNTTVSSTIEAAVLDLEELVCRIKWLKDMLTSHTVKCSSGTEVSSWVFEEYRESSLQ